MQLRSVPRVLARVCQESRRRGFLQARQTTKTMIYSVEQVLFEGEREELLQKAVETMVSTKAETTNAASVQP